MTPTPPVAPLGPRPPGSSPLSTVQASVWLKVAMSFLAVCLTFSLTAVGFGFGLFWSYLNCDNSSCSASGAVSIWLGPLIGLILGVAISVGFASKRTWFYANPMVVWLPASAVGGVALLGGLALI